MLVLVRQQNFLLSGQVWYLISGQVWYLIVSIPDLCTFTYFSKLLTSCLTAVKNMLSSIVKRYMRDPVKTYFGLLKIQVKF